MPTIWTDTILAENVASGAQGLVGIDPPGSGETRRQLRYTLTRLILRLSINPTVRDSGEGDQIVSLGIGMTSAEAFSAGVVADPATDSDYPAVGWLYRGVFRLYASKADDMFVQTIEIDKDLRAQRKMENRRMYLVCDNVANQGTATPLTITGITRALYITP